MAIPLVCLAPLSIDAAVFGNYTYTDNGSSITITDTTHGISGHVIVPATIDGKPVTAIGEHAFDDTPYLQGVTLPASVTRIGIAAFFNSTGLEEINIPAGVTTVEPATFAGCRRLHLIEVPEGVVSIGDQAFAGCQKLDRIYLPDSLQTLGPLAFQGCLASGVIIPGNVKTVGKQAFADCKTRELKLLSGATVVGTGAFSNCKYLTKVSLQEGTRKISDRMFSGCLSLARIRIPSTVKEIGDSAFERTALDKLDLPESLVRIGAQAFSTCTKLTLVTFPKNVREIGDMAFFFCSGLTGVLFQGDAPVLGKTVFRPVPRDFRIYFEESSKGYTVPTWHGFKVSLSKEEIEVRKETGTILTSGHSEIGFRSAMLGEDGRTSRFTIRNIGFRKLTGLKARIHHGDSGDFTVKNLSKISLAPGQTAVLDITFHPRKFGKRASTLWLFNSDADEGRFEVKLTGTGLMLVD